MARTNQGKRTNATVQTEIRRMRRHGKSIRQTAKIVGVSPNTVVKYQSDDKKTA